METITTDVLVIGAGAAGIRAALAAFEQGADVFLVAKGQITRSGSTFSPISKGWGIQALVGSERNDENLKNFYDDIIRVGLGQCDPKLVRILVEESGPRFEDLIQYGIRFKKDTQGGFIRSKGCFSNDERAFITEDLANIQQSFMSPLQRIPAKLIQANVLDLIVVDGECWGAWALAPDGGLIKIHAKATVLATGGGAGLFSDHLVSEDEIGDGYALAYRAGAELKNMEFIQFMLGVKKDKARLFLPLFDIGKPGVLIDSSGRDLFEKYILDLQTRRKAIVERKKHFPFSCRDSSHLVDIAVEKERRNGGKVFWEDGSKSEEKPEVLHFSHAFNGGVTINEMAESTVPGLFAVGETAAGPHGADRIGGCMMTATQVFGKRAGQFAALRARSISAIPFKQKRPAYVRKAIHQKEYNPENESFISSEKKLRHIFSKQLMLSRNEKGLVACLSAINKMDTCINEVKNTNIEVVSNMTNRFMVMKLIIKSAMKRKESLGPHYRIDVAN
jgi:L-aspartate oxidase